jgi:hypothetical protein
MADYPPDVAGNSQSIINNVPAHDSPPTLQSLRQDTSLPDAHDEFRPLPQGCWIVPFHGECPRCYHHHSAVQVKVKVTQDLNQLSYVHCGNCQQRWPAFGGRNSTKISLLSTTTIEPELIEKRVYYSLVEVVQAITGAAPLRTLPESSSTVPSCQPSFNTSIRNVICSAPPARHQVSSVAQLPIASSTEIGACHQQELPATSHSSAHPVAVNYRRGPSRLLSKLKDKVMARISRSYKNKKLFLEPHDQMSARQIEKPLGQLQPVPAQIIATEHSLAEDQSLRDMDKVGVDIAGSYKRLAEVVAFVANLDKTILNSKNEEERIEWMRVEYADFKAGRRRPSGALALSAIFHTSIPDTTPQSRSMTPDQFSAELRCVGTHTEGLDLLAAALRRGSLTNSDLNADTQSVSDESIVTSFTRPSRQEFLERVRRGLGSQRQRPLSLDSAPRSAPHRHSRLRHSVDILRSNETEGTSSVRGQASSRWSNSTSTTAHEALPREAAHYSENHAAHDTEAPESPAL